MLPAATSCSSGFHKCVRMRSTSVIIARCFAAERIAEPGREFEPAGAAADDDDVMQWRGI